RRSPAGRARRILRLFLRMLVYLSKDCQKREAADVHLSSNSSTYMIRLPPPHTWCFCTKLDGSVVGPHFVSYTLIS
uniref:Uncharacterized protein n=1 Tax=Aegilops tauschii subsp. strangulata TaxID=200361 RepID=A0A453MH56_AEGTS